MHDPYEPEKHLIVPDTKEYLLKKWSIPKVLRDSVKREFPVITQGAIHYTKFFDGAIKVEPATDEYHEPTIFFDSGSHSFRMDLEAARILHKQLEDALRSINETNHIQN